MSPGLASFGRRVQARAAKLVGSKPFWFVALALLFSVPIGRALAVGVPKPPEMKLALPAFELTDETGRRFGSADLRGQVWIADFVFTSCPTACPKLTQKMALLQHRARHLGDVFHLVTFTVDPENDTPERLAAYAEAYHANPRRWTFLTGPLADVEPTVVKGFKIAMGKEVDPQSGLFSIFHGEKLVLVDKLGNVRGYYDADDDGMDRILRDAGILVNVRE